MRWHTQYINDPRFSSIFRVVTGRPAWVLKATVAVGIVVFAIPLIALALLMLAALAVTVLTWTGLSAIARVIDSFTGNKPVDLTPDSPADDGRENVRVMDR